MSDIVTSAKDLLVTAGVGVEAATSGWGIFAGRAPKEPDTVIGIEQTGGLPSNPRWLLDFPALQVRVRGSRDDYFSAFNKAREVKDALLGLPSQTVNGDRWTSVTMLGDIVSLGIDELNRYMFALNFSLIIEPATGDNRIPL